MNLRYIEEGLSGRAAALRLKLSPATGARWARHIRKTGRIAPAPQGRPKGSGKLAPHVPFFEELIGQDPDITLFELRDALADASGLRVQHSAIGRMRLMIVGLMAATATTALAFGEALDTIIAAFSSLAVFLPVAFGSLYLKNPPQASAVGSMSLGLVTAILFTAIDQNSASLVGFLVALGVYVTGMKTGLRFAGLLKTHK